jgi:hypothetical protein
MPIKIKEGDGGKITTIHVSGKLVKEDYEQFLPEFERVVRQHGKLRLLFDMTGFHGLDAAALWEEIKFDSKHLGDIERCAMVGDKQWQHILTVFSKPFMRAKTQYFDHIELAGARSWLAQE